MDFGPIQFRTSTYRASYDIELVFRDENLAQIGTASGSFGIRRLTWTAGVSSPYNADPEPWRDGTSFDLLAGDGTVTQGWAWTYYSDSASEGLFSHGGIGLFDTQRWWWDTAINYSDLSNTRFGVVRHWLPTMRTGQTFDYDFDMTARYQDGALAFVQTNTEKRIGAIEEVTIPLGRYEAYRVTTASTRRAADGLWTFSATTEYWRPDMGLLSAIETLVQTYDFVQEERTLAIYSMRQHTP